MNGAAGKLVFMGTGLGGGGADAFFLFPHSSNDRETFEWNQRLRLTWEL